MVEPLIRWLEDGTGYRFSDSGQTLSSKWYADDATLVTESLEAMQALCSKIDAFSKWSGIRENTAKCRTTGFIPDFQRFKKDIQRKGALEGLLSSLRLGGQRIPVLPQDEPLPGGYLGTCLTASLHNGAHLNWARDTLKKSVSDVVGAPLPPTAAQTLLQYTAHAKINHSHCLTALSWAEVAQPDAILVGGARRIHSLPRGFPRVGIQAEQRELGLNFPSIWEDYSATAARLWINLLNDKGELGGTARRSLQRASDRFHNYPPTLALTHCDSVMGRVAAILISSDIYPTGSPPIWQGSQISTDLITALIPALGPDGAPLEEQPFPEATKVLARLAPFWEYGVLEWKQVLRRTPSGAPKVLSDSELLNAGTMSGASSTGPPVLRALGYLRCLLTSSSMQDFQRRRSQLTAKHLQPEPIVAARWRRMRFHWDCIPEAPAPWKQSADTEPPSVLSLIQEHAKRPPPPEETRIEISVFRGQQFPRKRKNDKRHAPLTLPLRGSDQAGEYSEITAVHELRKRKVYEQRGRGRKCTGEVWEYRVSWAPEPCPYFNVKNQKRAGFRVQDIQVLQKVQELPELDDSDLEAICAKCNRYKRVESGEPYQCERCFKWFHAECLHPATTVAVIEAQACWTCPGCAPATARNPVDLQLCKVQWADDWQGVHHIKSIKGGRNALEEFREKEMRQKADATRNKSMREAAPTVFGAPTSRISDETENTYGYSYEYLG